MLLVVLFYALTIVRLGAVHDNADHSAIDTGAGNRRTLTVLALLVVAMVGLAYASVPLYDLFCRVTGYGTTRQTENADAIIIDHPVKVRFEANVNPSLNWRFEPVDAPVTPNPGEEVIINYRENLVTCHLSVHQHSM